MKAKNLVGTFLLFFCTVCLVSCDHEDDGIRGFMQEATISGDSINGYYCYLDGGGLAISYNRELAGIERGYFSVNYMEKDWKTTADNAIYIDNAYVFPYSVYQVIRPINLEEAERQHLLDKDSCAIPSLLTLSYGYRGYFDFNTGLSIVNPKNAEKMPVRLHIVYDPAKQTPDTLRLQLCYHPSIPDTWSNTSFDYGSASCDISSLAALQQWSDSVTIVLEAGDKRKHATKIGKEDFRKPDIK